MARKTKKDRKAVVVYKYGLLTPTTNADLVEQQMRQAHRMYNELVEQERKNRQEYRDLLQEDGGLSVITARYEALKTEEATLRELVKKKRAKARSRQVDVDEEKLRLADIKAEKKALSPRMKAAKVAAREALKPKVEALQEADKNAIVAIRQKYAADGLFWPTYNRVIEMADQARKKTRQLGEMPRFRSYDGSGLIAFQVQGGMTSEQIFTANKRVEVDPVDPTAFETRSGRRNKTKTLLRIRIGSTGPGNREPIFAEFPMKLHRPLPADGDIKFVQVNRRRVGRRFVWSVTFTITLAEAPPLRSMKRMVAIDVGWRKRDNTYRHAYWYDHEGNHGEYLLPERYVTTFPHVDSLQQIRSENFNAIQAQIVAFRQENEKDVPTWFKDETRYLFQWRAPRKLIRLFKMWGENRFDGDATVYDALKAYVEQENHLWDWERNKRYKVSLRRQDMFNNIAHDLAQRYDVVFVEDINHQDLARRAAVEKEQTQTDAMRRARAFCAPGALIEAIQKAMAKVGGHVVKVDPAMTTRVCHVCGHDREWNQVELDHTCAGCGKTWDQDLNAAINIFRWGIDDLNKMSKAS